ncbi:hypothetical protein C5167_046890 [Papaver somniferum]|uniref:Ubiquitin-like domain-containing protein n=1 Tax=Papaver somniferum TaxID=3469 RepID=A0A4Y7LF10_PAPSO|nr:uncharacterized protein LOC113322557 [Papaver somniferum]XP_026426450.1 uncharacterized protein LOC113322557 [Papaver somniferum]XP_026426451.1 uncharacterized protein LOC113322557 [Papaver somniferum]RZC84084.1 hypothetical protein C5167_046890 [Papaver somniferum]
MDLNIIPSDGKGFTIRVVLTHTVLQMKENISYTQGIPVSNQEIIFNEKLMWDEYRILSYYVPQGAILQLLVCNKHDSHSSSTPLNNNNKHLPGTYILPLAPLDPTALSPSLLPLQFCSGHPSTCSPYPFFYGLSPLFRSLDLFPSSPWLSSTLTYAEEDHHIPNYPPFLLPIPPTSLPLPEDHHVNQQNPQGTLETTGPSASFTSNIFFSKILFVLANIPLLRKQITMVMDSTETVRQLKKSIMVASPELPDVFAIVTSSGFELLDENCCLSVYQSFMDVSRVNVIVDPSKSKPFSQGVGISATNIRSHDTNSFSELQFKVFPVLGSNTMVMEMNPLANVGELRKELQKFHDLLERRLPAVYFFVYEHMLMNEACSFDYYKVQQGSMINIVTA